MIEVEYDPGVLSRFEDVWTAVHDPATFCSEVPEGELFTMIEFLDPRGTTRCGP